VGTQIGLSKEKNLVLQITLYKKKKGVCMALVANYLPNFLQNYWKRYPTRARIRGPLDGKIIQLEDNKTIIH
jgi:hypothetical protein